ncbi:MAG: RNA polymerase sigma factor [Spongiibacteraceae bacterium]|nr:RNA polymerase sigma factor [Spongiibacteraceae bacterium]
MFLLRMLGDRHLAEDILQDAMVQAWRKASEFDAAKAKASTWIITIARNKALDQLRKTGRFNRLVTEDEYQIGNTLHQTGANTTLDALSSKTAGRLSECMNEITADSAACIQLAYIKGFSYSEIAKIKDKSISTVKSWVSRGLSKLKVCMQR